MGQKYTHSVRPYNIPSQNLDAFPRGEACGGSNVDEISPPHRLAERGW